MSVGAVNNTSVEGVKDTNEKDQDIVVQNNVEMEEETDQGRDSKIGNQEYTSSYLRFQLHNSDHVVFTNSTTQSVDVQQVPDSNPDGPPQDATNGVDAANRLMSNYSAKVFVEIVEKNLGNEQFLKDFFKTLGPETTAAIVADAANHPAVVSEGDLKILAQGLAKADRTLPASFDTAFAQATAKNSHHALAISRVLGLMPTKDGIYLQRAFLREVMKDGIALGVPSDEIGQNDQYMYARAAGQVLGANPDLAHRYLGRNGLLTKDQLNTFIDNVNRFGPDGYVVGMIDLGLPRVDGFERAIANLSGDDMQNLIQNHSEAFNKLVGMFTDNSRYFSSEALAGLVRATSRVPDEKLAAKMFYQFANMMRDDKYKNSNLFTTPDFKDTLADYFTAHTNSIMTFGIRPGSQAGIESKYQLNLATFVRNEFFKVPIGESQLKAMDAYAGWINQVGADLLNSTPEVDANLLEPGVQPPTMTPVQFEAKWGISRENAARVLGSAVGIMKMGLKAAEADVRSSIATLDWNNRTWAGIIVEGIRRGIQNLAPELLAKNPLGAAALALIAKTSGFYVTQLTETQKREELERATQQLMEELQTNPRAFIESLKEKFLQVLPNTTNDLSNLNFLAGYEETSNNDDLLSLFK